MKTNEQINLDIYLHGADLFELVRNNVLNLATVSEAEAENREKLEAQVEKLIDYAEMARNSMSYDQLWNICWQRIVYAGTRASKATAEIESMLNLPLFGNLDDYNDADFHFDKKKWQEFVAQQKDKYGAVNWLEKAKASSEWNPDKDLIFIGPVLRDILIKKDPTIKFSAMDHKIEKYIQVAKKLSEAKKLNAIPALDVYTNGYKASSDVLVGTDLHLERKELEKINSNFEEDLGKITALHTMMDLGYKVIKPDRVMTYLFSRLGWLNTLPNTASMKEVEQKYTNQAVINEVLSRADVLAYRLAQEGYEQPYRLLDIWFVKYGQEPEPEWGITTNLQKEKCISELFEEAKAIEPKRTITLEEVIDNWR